MEETSNFIIQPFSPESFYFAKGTGMSNFGHEGGSNQKALIEMKVGNLYPIDLYMLPANITELKEHIPTNQFSCSPAVICRHEGFQGENISACIVIGWLYDETSNKQFGIVTKTAINEDAEIAEKQCFDKLDKISSEYYPELNLQDYSQICHSAHVSQHYGTVTVAMVFNDLKLPFKGF